jgi:CTP synthase
VVGLISEWLHTDNQSKRQASQDMGGTMRLGSYDCHLVSDSKASTIYQSIEIQERHRHRYEVNMSYRKHLESVGLYIVGFSPDKALPEIVERRDHPWFIAVQFHPELKSKPFAPHPLFVSFIKAAIQQEHLG